MKVVINQKSLNVKIIDLSNAELNQNQKRTYKFAEEILEKGTCMLKIEARSRLAANGLFLTDIYQELSD